MPREYHRGDGMLRLIGVVKLLKSLLLFSAAVYSIHLARSDVDNVLLAWARRFHVAPGNRLVQEALEKLPNVPKKEWKVLAGILFAYSAMFCVEGIGLFLLKKWAEWMTVLTTAGLIPLEIHELIHHFGRGKLAAMIVNILILIYLILRLVKGKRETHAQ